MKSKPQPKSKSKVAAAARPTRLEQLVTYRQSLLPRYHSVKSRSQAYFVRHPLISTLVALGVMLALIALQSFLNKPKVEEAAKPQPKKVALFSIGQAPRMQVSARVEKSGVIKVVAQTAGIVQDITYPQGAQVAFGTQLAHISTNYTGANAASVSRQIAGKQSQFANDTYDAQKGIIEASRKVAEKSDEDADRMRDISSKSVEQSRSLLSLNNDILNSLNTNLKDLEANNAGGVNNASILGIKQQKTAYQSAANSIESGIRTLEYTTDSTGRQAELGNINRDILLRQLDLQEKSLLLNKEISALQLALATISESLSYPASPCIGVIEKVHVREGQAVSPGTVLFTISTNDKSGLAVALVSGEVANRVSRTEASTIRIGTHTISQVPSYVSAEATDGSLYSVYFNVPQEHLSRVANDGYIGVDLAVGRSQSSAAVPYIPLDAVIQTQQQAIVHLLGSNNRVKAARVALGNVYGDYIEVSRGLKSADQVILDRRVIEGEKVVAQ